MSDSTGGYGAAKVVVLSREQMRAFDACAINECGVSGLLLMENAGRGAVDVLERGLLGGAALGKRVVVVAGTGNNGGDGFVVARHLAVRGAEVSVVLCGHGYRPPVAHYARRRYRGISGCAVDGGAAWRRTVRMARRRRGRRRRRRACGTCMIRCPA